jgi:hypothetical protein
MDLSLRRKLTILLLLAAAGIFVFRGPVRAYKYRSAWVDFAGPYVETRCWLRGINPYDRGAYVTEWSATGGYGLEALGGKGAAETPYPPSVLPLVTPLALLPWTVARVLWIAISCALILSLAWCATFIRAPVARDSKLLIFTLILLAPASHTLLWTGNMTLVSIACCVVGYYWVERENYPILAGIMIAIGTAAKPQIGAWVLLFYFVSRKWKLVATSLTTLAALTAGFSIWLLSHGVSWVKPYLAMSNNFLAPGLGTDFTAANSRRFNLLNVQVILDTFFNDRSLSNLFGYLLVVGMLSVWLFYFLKVRSREARLLAFGTLLTLSILPVYHRSYDTLLLIVPATWALGSFAPPLRKLVNTTRVLLALFLVPTGSMLVAMVAGNRIPQSISLRWWWNSLVMPHQNWLLLAISFCLLLALRKTCLVPTLADEFEAERQLSLK